MKERMQRSMGFDLKVTKLVISPVRRQVLYQQSIPVRLASAAASAAASEASGASGASGGVEQYALLS